MYKALIKGALFINLLLKGVKHEGEELSHT